MGLLWAVFMLHVVLYLCLFNLLSCLAACDMMEDRVLHLCLAAY